ncbi:MAG: hypothetical protein U0232_26465 [Thermomicrobiales bacterium]
MANELRVLLELGPKGKRVVAVAPAWPGLSRGAKTAEVAIAQLQAYLPRYAPVAKLAGMAAEFAASASVAVLGRHQAPAQPTSGASPLPSRTSTGKP